jgi:hypothetical protein
MNNLVSEANSDSDPFFRPALAAIVARAKVIEGYPKVIGRVFMG